MLCLIATVTPQQQIRAIHVATASAEDYVLSATPIPRRSMYYQPLLPDGQQQPTVSALDAQDRAITSGPPASADRWLAPNPIQLGSGHLRLSSRHSSEEEATLIEA